MSKAKKRVLVVDDTPENLQFLVALLKDKYAVVAETSGQKAIEIAKNSKPDLILLDIIMPQMDGYEVCRLLKSEPATSSIPVVFVTSKNDAFDDTIGYSVGASEYLTKPIEPDLLIATVEAYLG
jgi:putative two-component system response regulator